MEVFSSANVMFMLGGFVKTLEISALSIFFSLIFGTVLALVKAYAAKPFSLLVSAYIELFRCTPNLLWILFIYFTVKGNDVFISTLAFTIFTSAVMAEIVRGGIISIDRGQFEGAMSIGMTHAQTMRKVILPQVMRNILPSVSNEFVINIKDTSVLNVIGVTELYYFAGIIKRQNFQTFQTYLVVCVLYFILTFAITRLLRLIEKKMDGRGSYTIFGSQSDSSAEIHIRREGENHG